MHSVHKRTGILYLSLILSQIAFSGNVNAGYIRCDIAVSKDKESKFQRTGLPNQYYNDILHTKFTQDFIDLMKMKRGDVFRVLDIGAGDGLALAQLASISQKNSTKFEGLGIDYPDQTINVYRDQIHSLHKKYNTKIVTEDISAMHKLNWNKKYPNMPNIKSGTKRNIYIPKYDKKFDMATDCLGDFSYTSDVTNTVKNTLSMLNIGGVYHLAITWKMLMRPSVSVLYRWPNKSISFDVGRKINEGEKVVGGSDKALRYGFSLALESEKKSNSSKSNSNLEELTKWLASIKGVDLDIETSNGVHASVVNKALKGSVSKVRATVNGNYLKWEIRNGLKNCVKNPSNRQFLSDVYANKDYLCMYFPSDRKSWGYYKLINNLGVIQKSAKVRGFRVTIDEDGQRYYEFIPYVASAEVKNLVNDYVEYKASPENDMKLFRTNQTERKRREKYVERLIHAQPLGKFDKIDGFELRKLFNIQRRYGAILSVRMVRNEEKIEVPEVTMTWEGRSIPSFRNAQIGNVNSNLGDYYSHTDWDDGDKDNNNKNQNNDGVEMQTFDHDDKRKDDKELKIYDLD